MPSVRLEQVRVKEGGMEVETFYMVYVDGQSGSTKKHETLEEARTEAERLGVRRIWTKVYVLQVVDICQVKPVTEWTVKVATN